MSDKKQSETEQPRQQNKVWPLVKGIIWIIMIALGGLSLFICWFYLSPERRAANDHPALILYLIGLSFIGGVVLCLPRFITSNPKKYFITRVLTTGITGGAFALLLPIAVKSTTTGVGGLRHSILLATGGLLAILTLGETRRKNDNDLKAANELQIRHKETLEQQKKQFNEQLEEQQKQFNASAFKERKAERRERYTKAVEQLGSEEAPVRMGGVYTLVGLVDEWLEDKNLSDDHRLKEGQVIINNLCAYIRSPFTLASHYDELSQDTPKTEMVYKDNQQKSHKKWQIISNTLYACIRSRFNSASRYDELSQDNPTVFYKGREQEFYADKANLESEADVRLSIIKEIHDRLQGPEENTPGTWSDFEYDFSGSIFFYPVEFTKSYYKKLVTFGGSTYQDLADFSGSTYEKGVRFSTPNSPSTYQDLADFSGSTYQDLADFSGSTYEKGVLFSTSDSPSTYQGLADFSGSTYQDLAAFRGSIYQGLAYFRDSTYEKDVLFSTPNSPSTYQELANFSGSTYQDLAAFSGSIYQGKAIFNGSTYQGEAVFSGSIFYSDAFLGENHDNGSSSCFTKYTPTFYQENYYQKTLFGSTNNDFTVDNDKGYPIDLNPEGIPLKCKFLTSEQKEYLADIFQEIEKINNKLLEAKDDKEKARLSDTLRSLYKELHKWREEATTVKVEDGAIENTES